MFGYFLSWLQEKKSSVYVIATANNAANLPPELKRKGRFDEIFYVDLPKEEERKQIFEVHLRKRDKHGINISGALVKATDGFNGADIESVVNEAVEDCFVNNQTFTDSVLLDFAKKTVSISKSCKTQIDEMDKIFKESNFKTA
jgi:SpoVK/Ycf46/Vps4 family AAA+-type ATPase